MKINIDEKKCLKPDECLKCLQICEPGVFLMHPKKKFNTDLESQLKINKLDYKISPRFIDSCNLCMDCVLVCPNSAIEVKN